ncbi:MAG TPA: SDR family oxidoreductase, partial [Candidatus Eisenbacteria bacterium]|nr:SDR family oxidoreductase [Candidatus Eisenbacteria bacterium]
MPTPSPNARKPLRRNILITGASSGLGRGMAREFAARGRNLALCARRTDRLEELREELTTAYPGITVTVRPLDVNDHDRVFEVFRSFRDELGSLDRVVVNAGLGKGQPLGTGYFYANKQTADTNFVAALAQCEAAMEVFRAQGEGHLVVISSVSALRGQPRNLTTYAASKAGVTALAEGIRADVMGSRIVVSTMFPGYIRSEMNERVKKTPFM